MQTEIDAVLAGLKADIQREILNHRGEGAGMVQSFTVNCRRHGERTATKFNNMLSRGDAVTIGEAATKAAAMVSAAIETAEAAGRVDFA